MTETHRTDETGPCPDSATLLALRDEPASADPGIERHVAACAACAGRLAEIDRVLGAAGAAPRMPDAAAMAAARERIAAAIGDAPEPAVREIPAWRRAAWIGALAAAALAAALLWNPGREAPPASDDRIVADAPAAGPDAVALEAERAAEAVVATIIARPADPAGDGDSVLDDAALASLAEIETVTPSLTDASDDESTALAERFAALSPEEQAAILDALSDPTFEL